MNRAPFLDRLLVENYIRPVMVAMLVRQARRIWAKEWVQFLAPMARQLLESLRDLAPIVLVIAFFQIVVLRQPFPDLGSVAIGMVSVLVGLGLFIKGLESGLFPLGEALVLDQIRIGRDKGGGGCVWRLGQ